MPGRRALLPLLAWWLCGAGFRGDGSGTYPTAQPPTDLGAASLAWHAPLPGWSNSSPLPAGELVCTTSEPTDLICLEARTGRVQWQARNEVVDTEVGHEQPALRTTLEDLARREAALPGLQAEQGRLRRELRRDPADAALANRLGQVGAEILALQQELERWRPYRTPPDKEMIGYATPTPTTDGRHVWALFGNGVLSCFRLDGTRVWSRWLGEPPPEMHGYSYGTTTSPLLVDGVLIVGFRELSGYDPATGRRLWQGPAWREYGTPAAVDVGGTWVIVTPVGDVLRARDGTRLAKGLAEVWFTSPVARGTTVWLAGGRTGAHLAQDGIRAYRVTLAAEAGGGVRATQDWATSIPLKERVYASPVVVDGRVLLTDLHSRVFALDAATGALLPPTEGRALDSRGAYASLVATADHVYVGSERGFTAVLDARDPTRTVARSETEGYRATPVPEGRRLYIRTLSGLTAYEVPK